MTERQKIAKKVFEEMLRIYAPVLGDTSLDERFEAASEALELLKRAAK